MEEPVRRVFAIEIAGYFAAEKSACDRVPGVASELRAAAGLIDINKERAGVRAVERANGMACFWHRIQNLSRFARET